MRDVFQLLLTASQSNLEALNAKAILEGWIGSTGYQDDRDDDDGEYDDDGDDDKDDDKEDEKDDENDEDGEDDKDGDD